MPNVIALTQFVFIALGSAAVIVLSRAQGLAPSLVHDLRIYMANHAIWALAVPLLWWVFAWAILNVTKGVVVQKIVQASGVLLGAAILVFYGWLVFTP